MTATDRDVTCEMTIVVARRRELPYSYDCGQIAMHGMELPTSRAVEDADGVITWEPMVKRYLVCPDCLDSNQRQGVELRAVSVESVLAARSETV